MLTHDPDDLVLLDDLLGIRDADKLHYRMSRPTRGADGLTALINSASLARPEPAVVCHRGCALDRRGKRIAARRLPGSGPANPGVDADHPSAGIPRPH